MMIRQSARVAVVIGLWASTPVSAHHWFAAQYDSQRIVTLTGTVVRLEWTNPHTRFFMNVKDGLGVVSLWELEMGSPNGMHRLGWSAKSLKEGDVVTVSAFLAKDRPHLANARWVTLSGGRKLVTNSAEDGVPSK